jgi:hypothetical protein
VLNVAFNGFIFRILDDEEFSVSQTSLSQPSQSLYSPSEVSDYKQAGRKHGGSRSPQQDGADVNIFLTGVQQSHMEGIGFDEEDEEEELKSLERKKLFIRTDSNEDYQMGELNDTEYAAFNEKNQGLAAATDDEVSGIFTELQSLHSSSQGGYKATAGGGATVGGGGGGGGSQGSAGVYQSHLNTSHTANLTDSSLNPTEAVSPRQGRFEENPGHYRTIPVPDSLKEPPLLNLMQSVSTLDILKAKSKYPNIFVNRLVE